MTLFKKLLATWKEDKLLRRVVKNSSYLFSSSTLSLPIQAVQGILAARTLNVENYGLMAIVITFVATTNRLLSFRMGEPVVKYMGEFVTQGKRERAAAVVKAAALTESVTSLFTYLLLFLLAPWAAGYFAKDPTSVPLFRFYGLMLVANLIPETSTGILQVGRHFRSQAAINLLQSLVTCAALAWAFISHGTIWMVLFAYFLGKVLYGIGMTGYAFYQVGKMLGADWWKVSFKYLPEGKGFWKFAISTNLSGTINLFARDSEELWVGHFLDTKAVGYYKVAKAVMNLILMPINPFINTTFPEIAQTIARRAWNQLRNLLRRLTWLSLVWNGLVVIGLAIFGAWLIPFAYGAAYAPSYPATMILLIGFGIANILYWNRNLILSLGHPNYALGVTAVAGLVKIILTYLLVPRFGYLMQAALLSAFLAVSVGLITLRGLSLVNHQAKVEPTSLPDLEPVIPLEQKPEKAPRSSVRTSFSRFTSSGINRWDWLAVLTFLAFAGLYFLGRLQGNYPVVILTGDGGNIASYAAALDHPDWFKIDPALGDSNNIGIYATIHIPLIRALDRLTGDYGLAYALLVFPQTFLQLLGFYFLGRVLFKNRFWAFLLAFLTAMTVINIGLGEIWGVWQDALPRVTFQSLLPFLLALVLVWKDHPERWPWLMVIAGLLVYVHPISAPAWGLAIWLSLWLLHPKGWNWKRRILVMFGLGVLFLIPLVPYAINYLSYNLRGQAVDYTTVMTVLQTYSPANLLNPAAALGAFLWNSTRSLLLPVALVGFVATWLLMKKDRTPVIVVLFWIVGLFITSILIPFTEQMIEQRLHILPLETELVRCIRYFVPLFLLFWLWPLVELVPRLANLQARRAVIALGIVLFGFWGATNRPALRDMLQAVACLSKVRLVCASPLPIDNLIVTLRTQTQPGDGVLFFNEDTANTSQSLSVRYAAMRPLVYTLRDSGILGYSNRSALPGWLATTYQMEALRAMTDTQERLDGLVPLAVRLNTDYLVIDFKVTPETLAGLPVTVVMQNDVYLLLKLH